VDEKDELGKTFPSFRLKESASADAPREALPVPSPGRYAVPDGVHEPELGRGGMGRVLRLTDTHLQREVAVKELLPEYTKGPAGADPMMEALFLREARVLARLEHPGVVPVYELGRRDDGTPYYAMRRIHGKPLTKVLDLCASLDDRLALLQHYLHVVQTVGFAHSRGVVHRDLKPENVMVSGFGETQVIDWGLAVVDGQLAGGGVTAGTPAYMAPEQAAGTAVDARSDVWSLGVMLFELLAGRLLFAADDAKTVMGLVQSAPLPPVTDFEPKAPPALVKVVQRALERDPSRRFKDAGAMADALEAAMRARLPRSTAWVATTLTLGALLVFAGGWMLRLSSRAEEALGKQRVAVDDARRAQADAEARAALAALRAQDSYRAEALARRAAEATGAPLAQGVVMLATERGVPERVWTVKTAAGCSSLAAVGDTVACGTLNAVALFSAKDGAAVGELSTGPVGWQHALAAGPSALVSVGDDRRAHAWDVAGRREVTSWPLSAPATAVALDGVAPVVGLRNGEVVRIDGAGQPHVVDTHPGPVRVVAAQDGVIASASSGLLKVQGGEGAAELDRVVGALAFVDARHLVAGIERSVVRFDGLEARHVSPAARDDVRALALVPREGKAALLVSGDAAGVLRWHHADGAVEGELDAFAPGIQALAATGDGLVVVASVDRKLEAWRLPPASPVVLGDGVPTVHAVFPRGWLVMGTRDGRVRRLDLATGEEAQLEVRHTQAVRGLAEVAGAEQPDALRLLTGGDDGLVKGQRWNGAVEVVDSLAGHRVTALAAATDAQRAAWAYDDGTWVLWSLEFGKEIARAQASVVRALAFSADGRTLAAGREDKRVVLLDAETGKELATLDPVDAAVTSVAFAPKDDVLVGGSADGRVTAWRRADLRVLHRWSDARSRISTVAVSPDGALAAAGSDDGETLLWDLEGGALVARVPADSGDALVVAFRGDELISVGTDRVVHRWPVALRR